MNRLRRALYLFAASLIATIVVLAVRALFATGAFTTVSHHFDGTCTVVGGATRDLVVDEKDGLIFASQPGRLAAARLGELQKGFTGLPGTSAQFDPRGLALFRSDDGSLVLMAIVRPADDDAAIETFDVHLANHKVVLAQRSRITGGLLSDPTAVTAVSPDQFYVTNASTSTTSLGRFLEAFARVPRGNVVFFDGTVFRPVVNGFNGASGIEVSADLSHVYVGTGLGRTLYAFERNPFSGGLKEQGELQVGVAIEAVRRDGSGDLWIAGHPDSMEMPGVTRKIRASEIFRVPLREGVPQAADLVYSDPGTAFSAAGVGVMTGGSLLIGSPVSAMQICKLGTH